MYSATDLNKIIEVCFLMKSCLHLTDQDQDIPKVNRSISPKYDMCLGHIHFMTYPINQCRYWPPVCSLNIHGHIHFSTLLKVTSPIIQKSISHKYIRLSVIKIMIQKSNKHWCPNLKCLLLMHHLVAGSNTSKQLEE